MKKIYTSHSSLIALYNTYGNDIVMYLCCFVSNQQLIIEWHEYASSQLIAHKPKSRSPAVTALWIVFNPLFTKHTALCSHTCTMQIEMSFVSNHPGPMPCLGFIQFCPRLTSCISSRPLSHVSTVRFLPLPTAWLLEVLSLTGLLMCTQHFLSISTFSFLATSFA